MRGKKYILFICLLFFGTLTFLTTPVKAGTPQIAAGYGHTAGLNSDGTVIAEGSNFYGECDVDDWADIIQIAAEGYNTVGLDGKGKAVAVGWNIFGQCEVDSWNNIIQVAAGVYHTVGLKKNGSVIAVGWNQNGQCEVDDWNDIVQIASGYNHTLGLKEDGTVVAVGDNGVGQCSVFLWEDIDQVTAGAYHSIGLKNDGTVIAVGNNGDGQCDVYDWNDIVQVAAGINHTVGLRANGSVVAVGNNDYGQCEVDDWNDIVQVAAGSYHTIGLMGDGTVVAVGWDFYGQTSSVLDWDLDENECDFSISPTSASVDSEGGTGNVTVICASECIWTASSNEDWIIIASGSSGSGAGEVYYEIEENTSPISRIGTMTIAGETFTVSQDGFDCVFSISPIDTSFDSDGGTDSVIVICASECTWTASSNDAWIIIISGTSGSGNGEVLYDVEENTSTSTRTGTMTIANKTVIVTQEGYGCTYSISPIETANSSDGGTGNITVTVHEGCGWTASSNDSWITITSGNSGNGDGIVHYSIDKNNSVSDRMGTVTIEGQTFTVVQYGTEGPGGGCFFNLMWK